jgi:lia operon protein LiaG
MQVLPTLTLALLFLLPSVAPAQQGERYSLGGGDVAIYNLAGIVSVEPGTGSVAVEVTRGGADAAKLQVEEGELDGQETLRVLYPGDTVVYGGMERQSSTTLRVREDGTFGDGDSDDRHRGRKVRITGDGRGLRAHADLKVRMPAGAQVSLYLAVGKVTVANVNGELMVDGHSAAVSASGTRGDLVIDVGAGAVGVTGVQGSVHVDTGSGSVEVTNFAGDELTVDTGSGAVTGSGIKAAQVHIETGSGDIQLTGVTSPVVALETGSGSVGADLQGTVRELAVETGSGDVSVRAPASLAAEVELETGSGGIETEFPLQVTRHSRDHVVGQIGDGSGRVAIETGSGDVRLLKSPN